MWYDGKDWLARCLCPLLMPRRRVVPQKPPASIHLLGLPSRQQSSLISPFFAVLTDTLHRYHSTALINPLFSQPYVCLCQQPLCFDNHLDCLGVGGGKKPSYGSKLSREGSLLRGVLGVRGGGGAGSLQEFASVFSNVALAKHGISGNQQIRAGAHHVANRIQRDAAIHFNPEIQPPHFALVRQFGNFVQRIADKFLSAKSWIHAHHQNVMHQIQHFIQDRKSTRL